MPDPEELIEAGIEGRAAFRDGEPRTANPHPKGTPWHRMWIWGWKMEDRITNEGALRGATQGENAMPEDREMPKYVSHKEVWALKIEAVEVGQYGRGWITPEDDGYGAFGVSKEYLEKHKPKPGGYYVVYADGYESFSPAKAFEEGYTAI